MIRENQDMGEKQKQDVLDFNASEKISVGVVMEFLENHNTDKSGLECKDVARDIRNHIFERKGTIERITKARNITKLLIALDMNDEDRSKGLDFLQILNRILEENGEK